MSKERTLRLCNHKIQWTEHYRTKDGSTVPTVKLQGLWLRSFGFEIGDCIKIASPRPGYMEVVNMGNPDKPENVA